MKQMVLFYGAVLPFPRLPGLMPRGLDTVGLVPPVVLVLPVVPPPLSAGLEEFGGPHGLGSGSRFSVRDGWAPDSEPPPRAENGLLPNYRKRDQIHFKNKTFMKIQCSISHLKVQCVKWVINQDIQHSDSSLQHSLALLSAK